MKNKVIAETLEKQQKRLGEMLGKLDTQLSKHPKTTEEAPATSTDETTLPERPKKPDDQVKRANGKEPAKKEAFAWEKMGLEALWGEWIDLRFDTAIKRIESDMAYGIKELKAKGKKELKEAVDKLDAEWTKEKASPVKWTMPWTAHPKANAIIPGAVSDYEMP